MADMDKVLADVLRPVLSVSEVSELEEINARLGRIEALLLQRPATVSAPVRDLLSVEQFAAAIGRKPLYVYRRIASRQIAVTKAGKPYQIPADQVAKFRKIKATV
ncbi:hypothetical protein IMCC26134_15160 [Verrucomicrobia bacterium IMCC26134]|nr:hypothetical protein IMCC26134_15160 [Verrucomicrobia bacterium IMCC26134]